MQGGRAAYYDGLLALGGTLGIATRTPTATKNRGCAA